MRQIVFIPIACFIMMVFMMRYYQFSSPVVGSGDMPDMFTLSFWVMAFINYFLYAIAYMSVPMVMLAHYFITSNTYLNSQAMKWLSAISLCFAWTAFFST
ncbi:hypothetical protein AAEU28_20530 [Pseudoalteromonas sp. SS15]|uniref:hypothetical protein n=1 Tax=Pseudoalteromonas sp. SS15 TaxID=3139393 RepID=UPI003BA8A98C